MKATVLVPAKWFESKSSPKTIRALVLLMALIGPQVRADEQALKLPVKEDWSGISRITKDNDWLAVPGFIGYRGDKLAGKPGVSPQEILSDGSSTPVSVIANQKNPTLRTGGVAEFDGIANPTVALRGSATANAPFLLLNLDTRGKRNISVSYKLRDLDASTNNTVAPVALQYRTGTEKVFTDVPAAFAPDASIAAGRATLLTPIAVTLPEAANDQAKLQIRWITADASGNDEWIGIDDIVVTGEDVTVTAGSQSNEGSTKSAN
ncbi:MAG TPA: hypothetical protein VFZ59_22265 [Verrucomicrobiae bacterium]|nr:hypothetical protein [Verrucomicrobiae bacterium]